MSSDAVVTRSGVVAVIGAPNAGKSTFVNLMVGAKVSIVTHKVQTTRTRIRGVAIFDETQVVFIDTPGIFKPKRKLDEAMVNAAWEQVDGVDLRLLIIDAPAYHANLKEKATAAQRRAAEDTDLILQGLANERRKAVVVLNKIDLMPRENLLLLVQTLYENESVDEVFMISATKNLGIEDLRREVLHAMPEGPWMYPEDQLSDISDRLMAAEITREKLFLRLHQELPYALTVETESWKRTKKKELRIEQVIYVERDSQKALVLGQSGKTIKTVGQTAREELEALFGEKIHLFLFVKVRQNWMDDPARFREMGLGKDV